MTSTADPAKAHQPRFTAALLHPRHWPTWLLLGLWWLVSKLPLAALLRLGRVLGRLMYLAGGSRRRIVERNIELCFPELSAGQRRDLVKANFASYGMAVFEVAISWWWSHRRLENIVRVSGVEHLEALDGQGALLMAMHFTTLELGGQAINRLASIDAMYRPHKSPVYEYVQSVGRLKNSPDSAIYPRKDVRGVTRALRRGRVIWYAPDQDYGRKQSVFAPFFGVAAASVTATAKFARLGNARVLPFTHFRRADGSGYEVTVHPPLEDFPGEDEVADAARINAIVETFVRHCPDQYLWAHRRFKTRPPGEPPLYARDPK